MDSNTRTFNWDQVSMKTGATANPAAGADAVTITVPTGKRWKVYAFSQTMVTDVNAANRYAYVLHRNAASAVLERYMASRPVTASLTVGVSFGDAPAGGVVTNNGFFSETMPSFEAEAGDLINFYWLNIQATDDGAAVYYRYKEMPA